MYIIKYILNILGLFLLHNVSFCLTNKFNNSPEGISFSKIISEPKYLLTKSTQPSHPHLVYQSKNPIGDTWNKK